MSLPAATTRRLMVAAALLVALGLPFLLEGYTTYRVTMAMVYAIAIIGLHLLTGLNGQFSIGHGAFFAIGAYAAAIAIRDLQLSAYLAIPLGGAVGFVAGFLFGWPALRLGFVHLALATWGLALAVPQLLKAEELEFLTGGVQGIYLERPGPPAGLGLNDDQWWYLIALALLSGLLSLAWNLGRGRTGRALRAIRDNAIGAAPMGINVALYKTLTFGVAAGYAGDAGALGGLLSDFVAPDSYGVFFSILLLVGAVTGGLNSVWGAVLGGLLIQFLPDLAGTASGALSFPSYGLILLLLVYLMPQGLAGAGARLLNRFGLDQRPRAAPGR